MTTHLRIPPELAARLDAEAARRGVAVDELSAELLVAGLASIDDLEAFIGSGHSGRQHLGRRHREITSGIQGRRRARDL